jgi:large subunit ribosomal protein L25
MDVITLEAQPRALGKAGAKAVRREGEVPCVLYGPHAEPVHFRVPVLALRPLIYTAETHLVSVELDGDSYSCIIKDISYHPVTDVPVHVDFYALTEGEAVTLPVPVVTVGTPAGVHAGGNLSQPLHEVEVRSLPKDIPGSIEIDVSELEIGQSLQVSNLKAGNFEILTDPDLTVATVTPPAAEPVEEEPEGVLLEGEEIEGEGTEEAGGEPRPEGEGAEDASAEG